MKKLTFAVLFTLLCVFGSQSNVLAMGIHSTNDNDADDSPKLVMDLPVDDDDDTPTTVPSREQVALDNDDDEQNFQPISASEDELRALELQNGLNQEVQPSASSSSSSRTSYNLRIPTSSSPTVTSSSSNSSCSTQKKRTIAQKTVEQKFLDTLLDNLDRLMELQKKRKLSAYALISRTEECLRLIERLSTNLKSSDTEIRTHAVTLFNIIKIKLEELANKLGNLSQAIDDSSIIPLMLEISHAEGCIDIQPFNPSFSIREQEHDRSLLVSQETLDEKVTQIINSKEHPELSALLCSINYLMDDAMNLNDNETQKTYNCSTLTTLCEEASHIATSTRNTPEAYKVGIVREINRIDASYKNLTNPTLKKIIRDHLKKIKTALDIPTSRLSAPASRKLSPKSSPTASSSSSASSKNPDPIQMAASSSSMTSSDNDPDACLISNLTTLSYDYSNPALGEAHTRNLISLCSIIINHLTEKGIADRRTNTAIVSQIRDCIQAIYNNPELTKSTDLYLAIEKVLKKINQTLTCKKRKLRATSESESHEKENKKIKFNNEHIPLQEKKTTDETQVKNSATSIIAQNAETVKQPEQRYSINEAHLCEVYKTRREKNLKVAKLAQQQDQPATEQEKAEIIKTSNEVVALAKKVLPPSQLWITFSQAEKMSIQIIILKVPKACMRIEQSLSLSLPKLLQFKNASIKALRFLQKKMIQGSSTKPQ